MALPFAHFSPERISERIRGKKDQANEWRTDPAGTLLVPL
jgi:hypothetical protein